MLPGCWSLLRGIFMSRRSIVPMLSRHASTSAGSFVSSISVAVLVGGLAIQTAAQAIPIGDFNWTVHSDEECLDGAGLCGPLFSVGNFSTESFALGLLGASFFDVFVDLEADGSPSLSLGLEIGPGASGQSIDPLAGLDILSAGLRLTFAPGVPGFIRLLDPEDNVVAGLTAPGSLLIDYVIREVVVPVPEPSTLLLLMSGVMGIALRRKIQDRNALSHSRTKRHHLAAT
jgi:hypothetical protein